MGFFSNSTEGTDYELRYCENCLHQKPDDGGCAVWEAHLLYNYDDRHNSNNKDILNILIPRSKDGLGNEQCAMFAEDRARIRARQQLNLFEQ